MNSQFATVAWMRWRAFVNGLRSGRGKAEAASGLLMFIMALLVGVGPAIGFAFGSYYSVPSAPHLLPIFFWITFIYWQLIPAIAVTFSDAFDTASFLRYPVSLPTYYLLWIAFGLLDPALLVPVFWLAGIFTGIAFANPLLIPWSLVVLFTFVLVNVLLSRMILAYVERWMARRRTREIVGALLGFVGVGIQLVSRWIARYAPQHLHSPLYRRLDAIQQDLPPGAAAQAILSHRSGDAIAHFALLLLFAVLFGALLAFRLRAQYQGENLSEVAATRQKQKAIARPQRSWHHLPDPIGAIFEKELRTLFGTQQIWLILLSPFIMLIVMSGVGGSSSSSFLRSAYTLPAGAGYGLLSLSAYFCNSFSSEQGGIQLLYLAPVRFRAILIGKNVAHVLITLVQFTILLLALVFLSHPPNPALLALTVAALLFAIFTNLAAGNLLSLYFPRRVDPTRLHRQGSTVTGLAMLGLQFATIGIAFPVFLAAFYFHANGWATLAFLVLALGAYLAYREVLKHSDAVALRRREPLIAELTKAA